MTAPRRLQRKREAGWTTPLDAQGRKAVYVGRGTRYGNPWRIVPAAHDRWRYDVVNPDTGTCLGTFATKAQAAEAATQGYRMHVAEHPELLEAARQELAGLDLLCWCAEAEPGEPDWCHAAYLMTRVNERAVAR